MTSVVEELHPTRLEAMRSSAALPLGPFWPGGLAALADGATVVVQGRHAHRLDDALAVEATRELPADAAYNSFVLLGDGTVATKDLRRPGEERSTMSLLDPMTLEDRCGPVPLAEPAVARLSARGDLVVVVGVTALHRYAWDGSAGRLDPVAPPLTYLTRQDQSFGWDPVVTERHVWWMDNGDHTYQQSMAMLGRGVAAGPVRLWRADLGGDALAAVEICGRAAGAITNPPLVDEARGVVVGFDSANGVLAAFDVDTLLPRWTVELATAQHIVLYPDTGEILADRYEQGTGDGLAVIDVETGRVRCEAAIASPAQSVVFGAPGTARDAYYVSLSTIARVEFTD